MPVDVTLVLCWAAVGRAENRPQLVQDAQQWLNAHPNPGSSDNLQALHATLRFLVTDDPTSVWEWLEDKRKDGHREGTPLYPMWSRSAMAEATLYAGEQVELDLQDELVLWLRQDATMLAAQTMRKRPRRFRLHVGPNVRDKNQHGVAWWAEPRGEFWCQTIGSRAIFKGGGGGGLGWQMVGQPTLWIQWLLNAEGREHTPRLARWDEGEHGAFPADVDGSFPIGLLQRTSGNDFLDPFPIPIFSQEEVDMLRALILEDLWDPDFRRWTKGWRYRYDYNILRCKRGRVVKWQDVDVGSTKPAAMVVDGKRGREDTFSPSNYQSHRHSDGNRAEYNPTQRRVKTWNATDGNYLQTRKIKPASVRLQLFKPARKPKGLRRVSA